MSDLSLYKSCLKKVAIHLTDGIYKSCHKNPFSVMPSNIVNDLISATMDLQRSAGFRADDLEKLLTSGRLRELKIVEMGVPTIGENTIRDHSQTIRRILYFLNSGCHELEVLHLNVNNRFICLKSSIISEALESVLRNSPNLKDLICRVDFDLKALRTCNKLRSVRLHFLPQQRWYHFLAKENGELLQHKHLKFFSVCHIPLSIPIPHADIVVILRYCPELTSLGPIESSRALSRLHNMNISPSELKLRHCYWTDCKMFIDKNNSEILKLEEVIPDAVLHYPLIEELDIDAGLLKSIRCLRNLRNLVCLNITSWCDENISAVFRYVLQEIGSRLKHLSFEASRSSPVDVSIFLQYCPNLESLRIVGGMGPLSASSVIHLPHLQRLTFKDSGCNDVRRIFPQFSGCNQLTDLFLDVAPDLDDATLYFFLKRNSLSNLKVAYLYVCSLTELGFREFLLKAPQLEVIEIVDTVNGSSQFQRVIRDMNKKLSFNEYFLSEDDEFFHKRRNYLFL